MDKQKTSGLAIASLALGIVGFCTFGLSAIISLALGIVALCRMKKSKGMLKGQGFAIAGITISAFVLVVILVIMLFFLCLRESPAERTERILRNGRLADLPESATDVKVYGWAGIFTGEDYLMFRATPEDIEKFIAKSPSLKGATPEIFDSEHMHLPYQKEEESYTEEEFENRYKQKYFFPYHMDPKWYDLTIKVKGRQYEIPGDPNKKGHNSGSVLINDETDTVYIYVIWS